MLRIKDVLSMSKIKGHLCECRTCEWKRPKLKKLNYYSEPIDYLNMYGDLN